VLQIPVFGFFCTFVAAAIGAVLLLWVWRALMGQAARRLKRLIGTKAAQGQGGRQEAEPAG
jgi:uncharacterized membrane protein YdjX (TVP38/TMEM64 family)